MIAYVAAGLLVVYALYRIRPVNGLKHMEIEAFLQNKDKMEHVTILDVRDQTEYYQSHICGAINISLGRLPHVKLTELEGADEILLVANTRLQSKKAARILKKNGFQNLTHLQGGMPAYHGFKRKGRKCACLCSGA